MMARPRATSLAHELRRDEGGHLGAEILAVVEARLRFVGGALAPDILAVSDIDHLLRDDAGAGELQLRDGLADEPAQRPALHFERAGEMAGAHIAVVLGLHVAAVVSFDAAARRDPVAAKRREALLHVDGCVTVAIGPARVVDLEDSLMAYRFAT